MLLDNIFYGFFIFLNADRVRWMETQYVVESRIERMKDFDFLQVAEKN